MAFEEWLIHRQLTLTATGSNLTDFATKFLVYKGTGENSGNTIYCNGNCRDDFGDIRFSSDGETSLPYWIESYTSGTFAYIWVKIPSISTAGTQLSVYYKNASQTADSSGANTFLFFDDFATLDTTTTWTIVKSSSATVSAESGRLKILIVSPGESYPGGGIVSKSVIGNDADYTVETSSYREGGSDYAYGHMVGITDKRSFSDYYSYYCLDSGFALPSYITSSYRYRVSYDFNSSSGSTSYTSPIGNTVRTSVKIRGTEKTVAATFEVGANTYSLNVSSTDPAIDSKYLFLAYGEGYNQNTSGYFDFVAVRKYAATEPSVTAWGSEIFYIPFESKYNIGSWAEFESKYTIPAVLMDFESRYSIDVEINFESVYSMLCGVEFESIYNTKLSHGFSTWVNAIENLAILFRTRIQSITGRSVVFEEI